MYDSFVAHCRTGLSVARGDTVSHSDRVRRSDFDWGCGHGSTDGERAHVQLDSVVKARRDAQDSVMRSVSSTGSANLDVVASAGSSLLPACAGSDKMCTSTVGSACIAPHIHPHIVRHWFGIVKNFPRVDQLLRVLAPGSPVCVARGGNLTADLAYGNHPVVAPHAVGVQQTICADVVHGRALVFKLGSACGIPGLRVSPLAVMLEPKLRIIHDLTFARAGDHSSVNDDTVLFSAPSCELGHVLRDVLLRLLFLRKLRGPTARIVLFRVDVKYVFRQVLVDPVGVPVFGYAVGEYVVVDLRLQFGWRNSPGFWELMASALDHFHNNTTFQDTAGSPQEAAAVEHVRLAPPQGVRLRPSPVIVGSFPVAAATPGVERYYVDDGILVEVQWWPDGQRCMRAVQSLASDHFRLLGVRGASDPTLLSASKITNWDTRVGVLGLLVDTEALTVTAPAHKRLKLRLLLA